MTLYFQREMGTVMTYMGKEFKKEWIHVYV